MKNSPRLESASFLPETHAEIARRFGVPMTAVVTGAVARALNDVAAQAEAAGLPPAAVAVAGFLNVCREFCESLQQRTDSNESGMN